MKKKIRDAARDGKIRKSIVKVRYQKMDIKTIKWDYLETH